METANGQKRTKLRWIAILVPVVMAIVGWTYGLTERVNNLHHEVMVSQITGEVDARKLAEAQLWSAINEIKENTKGLPGFIAELKIALTKLGLDGVSER